MKLLDIRTREVVDFLDSNTPPYAILSHTWIIHDEPVLNQWAVDRKLHRQLPLHEKAIQGCKYAYKQGVVHLWVGSLCIDFSSSVTMEEVVNDSFQRLSKSSICTTYLPDLPADGPSFNINAWRQCNHWRWAWTLQELVVPPRVEFFDKEWNHRGSNTSPKLLPLLSSITGIPRNIFLDPTALFDISLGIRISWLARRLATRQEDTAYSLVAITGVAMAVRYGEGAERAFTRLQEEILRDTRDGSIFAWKSANNHEIRGPLARSPSEFRHFSAAPASGPWTFDGRVRFSSRGV